MCGGRYAEVRRGTQGYAGVRRGAQGYAGVRRGTQGYAGVRRGIVMHVCVLRLPASPCVCWCLSPLAMYDVCMYVCVVCWIFSFEE